jgi:hypothetical protein
LAKSFRTGGERGIRTLDTGVSPYNGLANRRLQPLGHLSGVGIDNIQNADCGLPKIYYPTQHGHCRASSAQPGKTQTGGGIIEPRTAFFGRHYTSDTYAGRVAVLSCGFGGSSQPIAAWVRYFTPEHYSLLIKYSIILEATQQFLLTDILFQ